MHSFGISTSRGRNTLTIKVRSQSLRLELDGVFLVMNYRRLVRVKLWYLKPRELEAKEVRKKKA
jgi:hypothetical protein